MEIKGSIGRVARAECYAKEIQHGDCFGGLMTCVPLPFPRENALQTRCHIKCHGQQPQKNVYRNPIKLDGLLTHLRLSGIM